MAGPIPAEFMCRPGDLVTLPEVAEHVARVARELEADSEALCELAQWDPALTARLLASANEARWGQSGLVNCVARAAAVLDRPVLGQLPDGLRGLRTFDNVPERLVTMEGFWLSAVRSAVAAAEIAKIGGKGRPNAVFVAGLLHDIGHLVLLQRATPEYRKALADTSEAAPNGPGLDHWERQQLAFDHTRVGAALLAAWRFPGCLRACVAHHHQPERAKTFRAEVAIVHIANSLDVLVQRGSEDYADAPPVAAAAWTRAGLTPADGLAIIDTVRLRSERARALFAA